PTIRICARSSRSPIVAKHTTGFTALTCHGPLAHVTMLRPASKLLYNHVPMRIVHIITRLIIGGAQENTLLSCEGQHDRGHDVTLITGPPIGPEGSLLEHAQRYGYR